MANPIPFVPLTAPFFDGSGDPEGKELVRKLGNLNRTWAVFFSTGPPWASQGTHAERLQLDPKGVPAGGLFVETNRSALYEARFVGRDPAWVFVLGAMSGLLAGRPTDLGSNDTGFPYSTSDGLDYRWSGTAWVALETIRGGAALANAGRLTKVGAAGTLAESAVTDDLTTILAALRNIGINHAAFSVAAGRAALTVQGATLNGVIELLTAEADADARVVGQIQASDVLGTNTEKRAAIITFTLDGATATKRGGRIRFFTKADNADTLTEWLTLTRAGNFGAGGQTAPAYPVDVTGDVNASGVYRVDGDQVVSNRGAALTAAGAAVVGTPDGNYSANEQTMLTDLMNLANNLRTRVNELEARLSFGSGGQGILP